MTQDYRINTFGLTQKQNQFVSANLPVRDCELYIADTPTDLIAINCEAMIVNASAMEQDDADMIFGYYQEVNGCTDETILWLGEPMPPKAARKFFKCYPDFDAITDKLKYLLLSAHSRSRKSYEYSEKLVNGLKILSLIRKRPGISTQTLTELTEQLWEYGIQPLVVDDGSEPEYRHFLKKSAISVWCCGIGKIWEKEPLSRRLLDIFRENCGIPM